MTEKEKNQIAVYRKQGLSYNNISKIINVSVNTIKTYCKRNGLGGVRAYTASSMVEVTACEYCGEPVSQNAGRKKKCFCSYKCRNKWWNDHMELVQRKANYECTCANCGKTFISYGNKSRRYCSHECYIEDRFGGAC